MTLSFESLLSTELKVTADGVKSKRGFQSRARILRRIFLSLFIGGRKDTKINTGYQMLRLLLDRITC
jgi:hypothetical protein